MEETTLLALTLTAASVGFVHTLMGPDHYVPFVAMSRARAWSMGKTVLITSLCGVGHVAGSVVLGLVGIAAGLGVGGLEWFEGIRGDVAGWLLLGFGLAYMAWGIRKAVRGRSHSHGHVHADGDAHAHAHGHVGDHSHVHGAKSITPWVLFTIFVFGPCEPLIPILMYPASKFDWWGVVVVASVFGVCTIGTMTTLVVVGCLRPLKGRTTFNLSRFGHAFAGLAVTLCGAAILSGL